MIDPPGREREGGQQAHEEYFKGKGKNNNEGCFHLWQSLAHGKELSDV